MTRTISDVTAQPLAFICDEVARQRSRPTQTACSERMKDYRASIEKLRKDAAEAALIRDLAADKIKRDMYDRLHTHLNRLADEVEQALKASEAK